MEELEKPLIGGKKGVAMKPSQNNNESAKFIVECNERVASHIAVIHLVWAPLGIEPFRNFIQSYIRQPAGIDHDLIVLFNGFSSDEETIEYKLLLKDVEYSSLFLIDPCFDIAAYRIAASKFNHDFFCFLNSYSVILVNDWLVKLYNYASQLGVGLVGAAGGYESIYHDYVFDLKSSKDRTTCWRRFISFDGSFYRRLRRTFGPIVLRPLLYYWYGPFPNYHIRTNAFMIRKNILNRIKWGKLVSKWDTQRFESGKKSLSKQIVNMGYELLVVGRNGRAYKRGDFHESNCFRQGEQENLLIADNRTDEYLKADSDRRKYLATIAWGDKAVFNDICGNTLNMKSRSERWQ
jgi:hypothetical protein